jgi:hypothetical protein
MNSSSRKEVIATAVSRRFNLGFFARKWVYSSGLAVDHIHKSSKMYSKFCLLSLTSWTLEETIFLFPLSSKQGVPFLTIHTARIHRRSTSTVLQRLFLATGLARGYTWETNSVLASSLVA